MGKEEKSTQRPGIDFTRDRGRSDVADSPELEEVQREAVRQSVELLHGPARVDYEKDELVVLVQVRNSKQYVRAFIEHYLALGARHLIFLDNGSNDGTVQTLKEYENVTVFRSLLPYRTHNVAMKQYLLERFGKGRWSLLVDIDELFDYPFSDVVSLEALLGYLNERSYTAVVAHMLDMFPEEPIRKDAPAIENDPLKEKYRFYDVSDVYSHGYGIVEDTGNTASNENIEILKGGVRQTLFGNKANLIKHPLIFYDEEIRPMDLSDHWVGNARIADFTGVLLHYKLSDRLYEDARSSVAEKNRSDNGTRRYSNFLKVLDEHPELQIKRETSKELESVDNLISDGFVVVSDEYLGFVENETAAGGGKQISGLGERLEEARRTVRESEADRVSSEAATTAKMFSRHSERFDVPNTPELELVQRFLLNYDVDLLHGPARVDYGKDELVVLCLLRNGRQYVRAFVEHYFSLGAKHLVFLDNGSTDGTVETLKEYENVTVLGTTMAFKRYQLLMRQYLLERFGKGRWSLLADIDELFDYPFSDVVSLESLLGYLNERSYTAVVAHMLDMFPEGPITETATDEDVPVKELHRFYELSGLSIFNYQDAEGQDVESFDNVVSNKDIGMLKGGIQRKLFNVSPQLTKHPLVFYDDEIRPIDLSEHWAGAARVADFSGVLLHYKILGLHSLVKREAKERRYVNRYGKYDKYLKVLEESPDLTVKSENSEELESTNDLIGTNFNVVSADYVEFVKQECLGAAQSAGNQESLQKLQEMLRVESMRIERAKHKNEELQKKNVELAEQKENLREKNGRLAEQKENLGERNKKLAKQKRNLQERNQDMKSKNESLRKEQKQSSERERQLKGELHKVRRQSNDLSASLNRIRSSRSWRLLDGLSRIRKVLTRGG